MKMRNQALKVRILVDNKRYRKKEVIWFKKAVNILLDKYNKL